MRLLSPLLTAISSLRSRLEELTDSPAVPLTILIAGGQLRHLGQPRQLR